MFTVKSIHKNRTKHGHSIAEFGPAFFLGVVGFFLPAFSLICLGVTYFSCYELNELETSEACKLSQAAAQSTSGPLIDITKRWEASGLGRFVNPIEEPVTKVTYTQSPSFEDQKRDSYVTVTTTVKCHPFINVPLFKGVAGLGAPMTFTLATQTFCEYPSVTAS